MKYAFFTFSGRSLPIAKRLLDEGNEVLVGMVSRPEKLKVNDLEGQKLKPEENRRRLSIYDGMIEKQDADKLLNEVGNLIRRKQDLFVVVDDSNVYNYGERLLRMGAHGFIQTKDDFDREQERSAAKRFVEKNYEILEAPEYQEFKKTQDGLDFLSDSNDCWVLKSNGNVGTTIIPRTKDTRLNHMQISGALRTNGKEYEKGGFVLEREIKNHVEFTPQIVFWEGQPIYSQVEFENKPIGAADTGPDSGGAINLVVRTDLEDPVNTLFFPPAVHKLAKNKPGIFIFDVGVLYDIDSERYYFTEFCGNRWGWGTIISELAMSTNKNKIASSYFERIMESKSPLRYKYGVMVRLCNTLPDNDFADLRQQDIPVYWRRAAEDYLWLYQVRKEGDSIVNVGMEDATLAYASGCGNSITSAVDCAYDVIENFSFKEILYRPKSDYLSRDYPTAILNRFHAVNHELFNIKEAA